MSVPEGRMRLELRRDEVWLITSILNAEVRDLRPSQALLDLAKPALRKMNDYLEAVDGQRPPYTLRSDSEKEEGVG